MMKMRSSTVLNQDGSVEVYFETLGNWEDFDSILFLLQNENGCKLISREEIIDLRKAQLYLNGLEFQLKHDDILGNWLYSENKINAPELKKLADSVIQTLKSYYGEE